MRKSTPCSFVIKASNKDSAYKMLAKIVSKVKDKCNEEDFDDSRVLEYDSYNEYTRKTSMYDYIRIYDMGDLLDFESAEDRYKVYLEVVREYFKRLDQGKSMTGYTGYIIEHWANRCVIWLPDISALDERVAAELVKESLSETYTQYKEENSNMKDE